MEVISQNDIYDGRPSAVCVGVFDGLHLGHQALLHRLVSEARERGLVSLAVTFEPHPRIVLSKGNDRVGLLTTAAERVGLFEAAGVDRLAILPFTRQFSDLTARQFLELCLRDRFRARYMLIGYNHHFGSDDAPPETYTSLAAEAGIEAQRAGVFCLPDGSKVSSTEVRKALSAGRVEGAAKLLGRSYSLSGRVVHGDAIGRAIGFPTANVVPEDGHKLIPADGVYAATASLDGGPALPAVVNVGSRPTVGGEDRRVEAHIIGFDSDIYGSQARLSFVTRLRDEMKFETLDDLAAQIRLDAEAASKALHGWRGGLIL